MNTHMSMVYSWLSLTSLHFLFHWLNFLFHSEKSHSSFFFLSPQGDVITTTRHRTAMVLRGYHYYPAWSNKDNDAPLLSPHPPTLIQLSNKYPPNHHHRYQGSFEIRVNSIAEHCLLKVALMTLIADLCSSRKQDCLSSTNSRKRLLVWYFVFFKNHNHRARMRHKVWSSLLRKWQPVPSFPLCLDMTILFNTTFKLIGDRQGGQTGQ